MTTSQVKQALENIINMLPDKKIIFTVSPIRHFKDGAHQNTISKATLQLAIEEVTQKYNTSKICYFPSFEIIIDELRDYRFYAEDMVHPSDVAVKYIFERFKETFIPESQYEQMRQNLKITKREKHRE